jgi:hypothetical protein
MPAKSRTNQRGNATGNCSSVEKDDGRDQEDPKPPPRVTISVRISSPDPDQEVVVPEEATPDAYLPPGWARIKLEPDW